MVWAARCGNFTEDLRLDNISVMSGGTLANAMPTAPYFQGPGAFSSGSAAFYGGPFLSNGSWWVGATLPQSNALAAYILQGGASGGTGPPGFWTLEGSLDGGTTWNSVNSEQARWSTDYERRAFLITQDDLTAYGAYRLNVRGQDPFQSSVLSIGNLQYFTFMPVGSPPAISAALSGNAIELTWPTNQPGLIVLQTFNLASGNWVPVTNAASIVNGKYQVTVPRSFSNSYFGLGVP
jgi:hypothetical protein